MKLVRVSVLTSAIGLALCGGMGVSADLQAAGSSSRVTPGATAQTTGRYIITFAEKGLADYKGGVYGFARTAPSPELVTAHSSRKLDAKSSAAVSYREYLAANRDQHVSAIEHLLGRRLTVLYTYDVTRNAISVAMSPAEAAKILGVPGVKAVSAVGIKQPATFRGPTFIGANTIWDGTNVPSYASATRGEGIKVGVIDTGAYALHPSFANDPTCGFSANLPKLVEKDCINSSTCTGPTPEADSGNGHGVHTSSTAAGNTIDNTASPPPLLPNGVTMSGVAPCAQVHSYKICDTNGCYDDAISAAIQNAILDQVDVINFSIGPTCGGGDPWVSTDTLDFLSAEAADVFVAASAGNTRTQCTNPTILTANNGPWMMTVAASTQDQIISPQITVVGPGTPPPDTQNVPLISGSTTLPPASTTDLNSYPLQTYPTNPIACTSTGGIAPGTFTGMIAILRRGTCGFAEKITNAANAGASMVLIGNNQPGAISMNTTGAPTTIAAFSMSQVQGDAIIAFVNANAGSIGDYRRAAIGYIQGDVLAGFSDRGPTVPPYDDLTKPDITGPGVNIYAALDAGEGNYGLFSGTSMSSPHLAGSGALIRAVHPNWSPMEVKSALQTTATLVGFQEDGVTQWTVDQVGSGRVDLTKAALAGLTLDETPENFAAASPDAAAADTIFANGFDLTPNLISGLNLASMRDANCATTCTWTRKFKNRLTTAGTWTVSTGATPAGYALSFDPPSFTLAPGYTRDVTFTATNTGGPSTKFAFGRFDLVESGALSPDQHLTVAVKGPQPVKDTSFESTPAAAGPNPYWDAADTNVAAAGGTDFCNPFDCGATAAARSGIWTVWFGGWGGGAETQFISQNVMFPASGPQILNYWRRVQKKPDVAGTLTVSIDGTPVQTVDLSTLAAVEPAYTHQSVDVSAYADGAMHLVKFEYVYLDAGATGKDGNVFIDDISIDPSNVVPFSTGTVLSGGAEKLTQ